MKLTLFVEDQEIAIEVPDGLLDDAGDYFAKLDRDMDRGWQMSRDFIENPDPRQRCQIVSDRMVTAMMSGNRNSVMLLAAYVLKRLPGVTEVNVDTSGDMHLTEFTQ